MIDIKLIVENPALVEANNRRRNAQIDLSIATGFAKNRAIFISQIDELRARGNEIAGLTPKATPDERPNLVQEGREIKEKVKGMEEQLAVIETGLEAELRKYPNVLRGDVPDGKDADSNKVVRTFGEPPVFDFEPKDHIALGEALGIIDVERAAKVSGSRFTYLKGDAVLLEFALIQYALTVLVPEGFVPVVPPHLVSTKAMGDMGYLEHGGEEEIYHLKHDDLVLIGTSEQAIGPMLTDEILSAENLPARYVGISPCYRREAGSFGRDVRGILRVHQFDKVEMFSFTSADQSDAEHEKILAMQEKLMQGLELSHRVMKLCAGDTGRPSARTYDIETWIPSQNQYRETHSTSNTTDYQTRRLSVRIKHADGHKELAHALNGTAFAIGRTLIAILENYQQADGTITVPVALRPWVGKSVIG